MKVVTVEQMRSIEAASDAAGHTYADMMEHAGRAVAQALQERTEVMGKRVLTLVGPGNNGGDGLVMARHLAEAGAEVACYVTRPRDPTEDENFRQAEELCTLCVLAREDQRGRTLRRQVAEADVVVDALLGTGTRLPVKGIVADVLKRVRRALERRAQPAAQRLVHVGSIPKRSSSTTPLMVAVDGPSGLDFDTGELDELALTADLTVTFAYPKRGHFRFPGAVSRGDLVVADIGTDPSLATEVDLEVVTPEMAKAWLPARPPDAHKGTFGRALVVGGSSNYTGAARLAGAAAVRAGAGLVTVALPATIHGAVAAGLTEATYVLLPDELGVIAEAAIEVLAQQVPEYDAVLVGPGLGRQPETCAFVEGLLSGRGRRPVGFSLGNERPAVPRSFPPLVVDADGLNIVANLRDWPARLPPGSVLTPHPGEMARLMGCSIADVQADRVETARQQALAWEHVVVLKGAYTVVAAPDGRTVLEPFANAGLATGGTGDVLAGIIVSLRAQGLDPFEAAATGAYLHGLAGELVAQKLGPVGMAAGDLVGLIPEATRRVSNAA